MTGASPRLGAESPARVVILRALKLGDLLCAVPAFRALRAAWPHSEIVLVGLPWARSFVARYRCYLDGFHELPGFPGLPEVEPQIERIPAFLARMQAERFDLAIQLHGSGPFVNPLTALFGARRSAGFYLPGDYCPDADLFLPWPTEGRESERLLRLVSFLGIPLCGTHLDFPLHPDDHAALRRLPEIKDLVPGRYLCVHPGASVSERRWPPEVFAQIAGTLARRDLTVVLTGTAAEAPLAERVVRSLGTPALNLAGQTDLGSLGALLAGARLLVCNDTGVSHLADALQVPSVVLSTGDNPPRWSPQDTKLHRVFRREDGASVEDLIAAAWDLLEQPPRRRSDKRLPSIASCRSL